ncbi:MAG: DNA repair protein RecO C-terminal domain-containing protein, partial [Pseudomonadota bacterium]
GLIAAYVHGGRSRKGKALLVAGNLLSARLERRAEGQLMRAALELETSRAALALDPLRLAMAEWLTMLIADCLPEGEAFVPVYESALAMFDLLDTEANAALLGKALAQFELMLLAALGFRLDLETCAATGVTGGEADLAFVSPRTGRAVGRVAGTPYEGRLFPLPAFLIDMDEAPPARTDIEAALAITRHFIRRDALPAHRADRSLAARDRVDARLAKGF